MKIEKLSDSQVKFVLSHSDLEERNIKLTELAYGTEKTQALFREMMEQASAVCGFEADNVPLMIEAIPFSADGITIIVTKVGDMSDMENRLGILQKPKERRAPAAKNTGEDTKIDAAEPADGEQKGENITIFSFDNLDIVTDVSVRLYGQFNGTNMLIKNQNRYFLVLHNDNEGDGLSNGDLDAVLSEFGKKHISTIIAKHYLTEHGELIAGHSAIKTMAEHMT